nr:DHH family phosphoesterase [Bifidobacterium choloepi]
MKELHDGGAAVTVLPDFDMDGISAGALGRAGLAMLGFDVRLYHPDATRGYGFGAWDIDRIAERFPDTAAILTCDVGITCHEGVAAARARGWKTLVTDHHTQLGPLGADIIVDPCATGESYEHPSICGAHVLWMVLDRYAELYDPERRRYLFALRALAALGTVGDQMDMSGENRQLMRDGLQVLRVNHDNPAVYATTGCREFDATMTGLAALTRCLADHRELDSADGIDEQLVGFRIAPMCNAPKRMGEPVGEVFDLFADPGGAHRRAEWLHDVNMRRKRAVAGYVAQLRVDEQPYAPNLYLTDAPLGIIGLIATKVLADTGMPVLVANRDLMRGSGRAPEWYDAIDTLNPLGHDLAGHQHAFGFTTDESKLRALADDIARTAADHRPAGDDAATGEDRAAILLDTRGDLGMPFTAADRRMFVEFPAALRHYAPFGPGWPEPDVEVVFHADDIHDMRTMGADGQHLKIRLDEGLDLVCWNQSMPAGDGPWAVRGSLSNNEWRGTVTPQLQGTVRTL